MNNAPIRNLIYLSSSQSLPSYLRGISGVRWHSIQTPEELKKFFMFQSEEACVIVRSDFLSAKAVRALLSGAKFKARLSFIFIAQTIEKAVHQLALVNPQVLVLFESEGSRITKLVTQCLMGKPIKSRKQERTPVQSEIMVKKSALAQNSPTGKWVQFLGEGCMQDFSQGGAQIALPRGGMKAKDFVSLMYRNCQGQWVSVESQVRWVVSTTQGSQIIGVQFLAMSA